MSFIASIYLWLIPLISIPLIFHLLKKRKYDTIEFSSLKFFLNIENESLKKINIVNILLLIIRTLIILFFILIFSNPTINGLTRKNSSNESTLLKILIDNSYSNTQFINNNLDTIIKDIIQSYPQNTFVSISTLDNQLLLEDFIQNINKPIRNNITSHGSFKINHAVDILNSDSYNQYINKDLFFISDFQKNIFKNLNTEKLSEHLNKWNIFLYQHNIIPNQISISDLKIINNHISINQLIDININAYNHTDSLLEGQLIEFYIDDIKVGDNIVNLNPNSDNILNFKTSIPDFGQHNCYITMNNVYYYFIINIPSALNAGLIYDKYNDVKYISNLLNVYNELNTNINQEKIPNNLIGNKSNYYDFVFKFTNSGLNEDQLLRYSNITDNLIIVPLKTLKLNNILSNREVLLSEINLKESYITLDDTYIDNYYLKELFNNYTHNYKIFKYFELPYNDNTLLVLSNNKPLLNKYEFDDINIYLFSISMDLQSSNIPISSSFIPLLEYMIFDNKYNYNKYIGEDLNFKSVKSNDTIVYNVNGLDDYYKSSTFFENKIHITDPGFHIFKFNQTDSLKFSANIDPNELYEDYFNKDSLKGYFFNPTFIDNETEISSVIKSKVGGIYLWRYLLYILTILIILEMYISNNYIYKND